MADLAVPQGVTRTWRLVLRAAATGLPVEDTYAGTETLTLQLWTGDGRSAATLTTSAATWESASLGRVSVTLDEADTATLTPGPYRVRVLLETGGKTYLAGEARVEVEAAPASTAAPTTYCSLDDVRRVAPWITELVAGAAATQSDLAEYRHAARVEFDGIVQRRYRASDVWPRDDSLDHLLGVPLRDGADDSTLAGSLDDDELVLTGATGERVVRWNALYTAYLVARDQIGDKDGERYERFARRCILECHQIAATLTVQVGTTAIDLGTSDAIRR